MPTFSNLVPDSALLQEAVEMLRLNGGRVSAESVADLVLQLPELGPESAALIVSELIEGDCRLRLTDDHKLELLCEDADRRPLSETDFVVFDIETTGPKMPHCRIMEIGACRVSGGRIVAEFQTLVNPEAAIPPFIARLTGITEVMVRRAPTFREVAADWLAFAGTAVLVAHNAPFDVSFINHEVARVFPGRRMVNEHLCTVALARRVYPELKSHRLHTLAEHLAVSCPERHRAGSDARATAEIFVLMLERLRRHGVTSLAEARSFRGRPAPR